MTTKKALFNGKSEILANFFAQQMPTPYRRVLSVLVNLKYPIHDKQSLCLQVEKVKEDESIKQTITECFQACDYGIDTVYSALEKFTANTSINSPNTQWNWNQNTVPTNRWTTNMNTGSTIPTWMNNTTPTSYQRPSVNRWNPSTMVNQTNGQWQFGSDICGEAACTLFCDMVSRGIAPQNAYDYCCNRENLCRTVLPNYGTSPNAVRAQCIFVNNFVIHGREVNDCDWCAQFYLNNCRTTETTMVNTVNNVTSHTVPTRTTNTVVAEFAN